MEYTEGVYENSASRNEKWCVLVSLLLFDLLLFFFLLMILLFD